MDSNERRQHLAVQQERIAALERASSILVTEGSGDPADRYRLYFRGRGLYRDRGTGTLALCDEHQCVLRLPYEFPREGPEIHWLTPIVHPNISFSGLVHWEDLNLPWTAALGLEVVCERLWDMARLAFVDWQRVVNQSAAHRLRNECHWSLPLDVRPLRDRDHHYVRNLVRYRSAQTSPASPSTADEEVLYIDAAFGDEQAAAATKREENDDVLFIGDDLPPAN